MNFRSKYENEDNDVISFIKMMIHLSINILYIPCSIQ
jgi:hypothetical protein